MTENERRNFEALKAGGLLPSPQGVAVAIARMALRDDVGTPELTRLIKTDPAMAGRLLRYANSAGAGGRRHIVSLHQAVTFLGLYRIRQLALAFSLVDMYRGGRCPGFDYSGYWSESLATGVGAQALCAYARIPPEDSFTCGLLANIGRLGLASAFPAEYGAILARRADGLIVASQLRAAEQRAFSIDHAVLSREMLLDWGLPSIFAEAVCFHEAPEEAPFAPGSRAEEVTWMLHLAALIAARLARKNHGNDDSQSLFHVAGRVGLEAGEVQATIERIQSTWLDWGRELGLPGEAKSVNELLIDVPAAGADAALVVAPMRVAVIAADRALLEQLAHWLEAWGQEAQLIDDWAAAAESVRTSMPDVVLVDPRRQEQPPAGVIQAIRQQESGHRAVVIALLPAGNEAQAPDLIHAGADDYLLLPPTEVALQARMHAAQRIVALQGFVRAEREASIRHSSDWARSNRRLLHEALSDALTLLPNRRYGLDHLTQELEFAAQNHLPLAVIMLDIDHFKPVNDTWGHTAGDEVLRQVAAAIQNSCRKEDVVFRFGGEEFCVVCPATAEKDAMGLAERMLDAVRDLCLPVADELLKVTVSAGVATRPAEAVPPEALIDAADAALYRAKDAGRDRVMLAPSAPAPAA